MNSKRKAVLSVLFLTAGILFLGTGILFWVLGVRENAGSPDKEPWCVVELEDVEKLGSTYEGIRAEEGYSFYELYYTVTNTGDAEAFRQLPNMYYESGEYDDLYDHYDWESMKEFPDEEPLFAGYYDACIPPGRTGRASEVLMIKDGVALIEASYYPGYSDEELLLDIFLPE